MAIALQICALTAFAQEIRTHAPQPLLGSLATKGLLELIDAICPLGHDVALSTPYPQLPPFAGPFCEHVC